MKSYIQHFYISNNDCGSIAISEAFESVGSKILPLPKICYISVNFTSVVRFPSKSMASISYFSKIRGFHGTHRTHANYAPQGYMGFDF